MQRIAHCMKSTFRTPPECLLRLLRPGLLRSRESERNRMKDCGGIRGFKMRYTMRLQKPGLQFKMSFTAQPPNSRLLTDACRSALRATFGAAKPGR